MLGIIRGSILGKTIFLFAVIVFAPVCVMAYFVYGILLENHDSNLRSSLSSGSDYIVSIFDLNSEIVSGKAVKLRDDYGFVKTAESVLFEGGKPSALMTYLKANYGFDFFCISDDSGDPGLLYSETLRIDGLDPGEYDMNKPLVRTFNGKFSVAVKTSFQTAAGNRIIIAGKIIDDYNIFEFSKILGFDFILFEENSNGFVNKFTTMYDEYGYGMPPGSLFISGHTGSMREMMTAELGGRKRKILSFELKNFAEGYFGAVSKVENYEYLKAAKEHFTLLIIFFIFLAVVLVVFIKSGILAPVIKLLEGIRTVSHQIENGLPVQSLNVKNRDEIGKLAAEYNRMASEIARSFSRIKYLQNYLLNIFESMPSGLIAVDNQGRITQWNKNAEKYTPEGSVLVKGDEVWKSLPELKISRDEVVRIISEKRHIEVYREPKQNGGRKNVNIHLFPLVSNGVTGSVIRIDDITELKKKEEQLAQSQKMETIGTLAGGIAHDFNNILAGIIGVVSLLRHKMDKGIKIPDDILEDYLDIMEQSGNRAADIVQRLLTLSKKQNISLAKVKISEVISHVIKICSNTFDKSISIKAGNIESGVYVLADFTQLEQIILNLSINAGHAMTIMRDKDDKWGGDLLIDIVEDPSKNEIAGFISEDDKRDFFRISIKDTGVGMNPSTVRQIFEPFFSTKDKTMGTGLGLTIVYNVVQQSGGFIDIDSEPGKGTEFKIFLPKYTGGIDELEQNTRESIVRGEGTVLVIDDEPILRELAVSMLSQAGYDVITASDGIKGIEIFKERSSEINVVLLDMMMPNKNGKETYIELREADSNVKVVMTSGFTRDKRVLEVLEMGAKDFIQKPYTIFSLSQKISKVLNE